MEVQDKLWGKNTVVYTSDKAILCFAEIEPNSHCSVHYHENRHNWFQVMEGSLGIEIWEKREGAEDREPDVVTWIDAVNGPICIPAGQVHRFITRKQSCKLVEIYTPFGGELSVDDITRLKIDY